MSTYYFIDFVYYIFNVLKFLFFVSCFSVNNTEGFAVSRLWKHKFSIQWKDWYSYWLYKHKDTYKFTSSLLFSN